MNTLQYPNFVLHTSLILILWPSTQADNIRVKRRVMPEATSPQSNHLHDHEAPPPVDTQPAYSTLHPHHGDTRSGGIPHSFSPHHEHGFPYSPSPFQHTSAPLPELPSPLVNHPLPPDSIAKYRYPNTRPQEIQPQHPHFHMKKGHPGEQNNYILTAGGKENVYTGDTPVATGFRTALHHDASFPAKLEPVGFSKKANFDKSFKKYKYSYSSHKGGNSPAGLQGREQPHAPSPSQEDQLKPHALPENQKYPHYLKPAAEKTDVYGPQSSTWLQLGPNVEISSSAEHPVVYNKKTDSGSSSGSTQSERSPNKGSSKKQRKSVPKNVRTGYMTQQHALYVANNLQNVQLPLKGDGSFDHNSMLKQSDKFEISDAMFQELEQEARKQQQAKEAHHQVRIKQELPHYHPEYSALQYYQQAGSNPEGAMFHNGGAGKYHQPPYHMNSFSKGFIRNIEIETGPPGGKKFIPALIIPLSPDQLANPFFGNELGLYINQPDILNPTVAAIAAKANKNHVQSVQAFPYEIVNARYTPNEIYNEGNYQYQHQLQHTHVPSVGFRSPATEEPYNPYLSYQQNFYRLPYNLNTGASVSSSPPPNTGDVKPSPVPLPSTDHQNVDIRSASYTPAAPKRSQRPQRQHSKQSPADNQHQQHQQQQQLQEQQHQTNQAHQHDVASKQYKTDYLFAAETEDKYLLPSESTHVTTISTASPTHTKEYQKDP